MTAYMDPLYIEAEGYYTDIVGAIPQQGQQQRQAPKKKKQPKDQNAQPAFPKQ